MVGSSRGWSWGLGVCHYGEFTGILTPFASEVDTYLYAKKCFFLIGQLKPPAISRERKLKKEDFQAP